MPFFDYVKKIFDLGETIEKYVPRHILRLVAGGLVLGIVLMLFLKVIDEIFDLTPQTLSYVAIPVTLIFAAILCPKISAIYERCIHYCAGAIVIFAVGLTSNNVIAGMRYDLGLDEAPATNGPPPPDVPPLNIILEKMRNNGG